MPAKNLFISITKKELIRAWKWMQMNKSFEMDGKLCTNVSILSNYFPGFYYLLKVLCSIISLKNIILSFLTVYNITRNYNFYWHIYIYIIYCSFNLVDY